MRNLTLHAFASTKGGVGKSTLAVTLARLLANHYAKPVLIVDCDLTGTSLADGLGLLAPQVAGWNDGKLNLSLPPTSATPHDLKTTQRLRDRRKNRPDSHEPAFVPFLNDALDFRPVQGGPDCRIDALLWQSEADPLLRLLPSSPLARDVELAIAWLFNREEPWAWVRRLAWVVDRALELIPDVSNVVFDLPPGLFGFSALVLTLLGYINRKETLPVDFPKWNETFSCNVNPFLVTTPDRNDLYAAVDALGPLLFEVPELLPVVNREDSKERVREVIKERFEVSGLDTLFETVPFAAMLSQLFRSQSSSKDLDRDSSLRDKLMRTLRVAR